MPTTLFCSPSHQAGGAPRCRAKWCLMAQPTPQPTPRPPLTNVHRIPFSSSLHGFPRSCHQTGCTARILHRGTLITGRLGCAGATGLRWEASRPGGRLPLVDPWPEEDRWPQPARTPATARDNQHHNLQSCPPPQPPPQPQPRILVQPRPQPRHQPEHSLSPECLDLSYNWSMAVK